MKERKGTLGVSILDTTATEVAAPAPARIAEIRTRTASADYIRPFAISSGVSHTLTSVVVEVRTEDGTVGFGESSPMTAYSGETEAGVTAAIRDHLAPAVIGTDPMAFAAAHVRMDAALRGQRIAKAGIDIALHDLAGRLTGLPAHRFLGGAVRTEVPSTWVVGLASVEESVAEAVERATAGFSHIKVKGGSDPDRDLTLVRAVRTALPDHVELSMDANEGYDLPTAQRVLPRMADAGLAIVEQPLPHWDLAGAARLRERLELRVMADESVQSLHQAHQVAAAGAADIINIKILKVGGLHRALQVAAIAEAAGLAVKIGSMPELGVATLAALHLSAALPHAGVPPDLVGPLLVRAEPLAPEAFTAAGGGSLAVPTGPGLGPVSGGGPDA